MKPEISKKLLDQFYDELNKNDVVRNQFRDKILYIVKNASKVRLIKLGLALKRNILKLNFFKGSQKFLTIVDMKGLAFDFNDLDKYILTALLQCNLN